MVYYLIENWSDVDSIRPVGRLIRKPSKDGFQLTMEGGPYHVSALVPDSFIEEARRLVRFRGTLKSLDLDAQGFIHQLMNRITLDSQSQ